ncbi:MAG: caspase family protein [Verrucomicrobiales bacterium]|nr:caspase family protein [Verrucomicrobiales bacterium]
MDRYFLTTGTGKYPHLEDADLPKVPKDLEAMTALFRDRCQLRALPDQIAPSGRSLRECLKGIQDWNRSRAAESAIVVYHSSHGVVVDGEFYLCDEESRMAGGESWNTETLLEVRRVARSLCGGRTKQLLLILDTCHAGAAVGDVNKVFARFDEDFAPAQGLKVHVLVACRRREEAVDGAFVEAFVTAVDRLGARYRDRRFLDLGQIVDEMRSVIGNRQTVELREILNQPGECQRVPNPAVHGAVARFSQSDLLLRVTELLTKNGALEGENTDQNWLWYAWHEGGMCRDTALDKGWREHLAARADRGLSGGICGVVCLLEGFGAMTRSLESDLHSLQRDWNQLRLADLEASRAEGQRRFREYQQWRKELTPELQVTVRDDGGFEVVPVLVVQSPGADRARWTQEPLPLAPHAGNDIPSVLSSLGDLTGRAVNKIPMRLMVPMAQLSAAHGDQLFTRQKTLRQSVPLTLHALERWALGGTKDPQDARAWKAVRSLILELRRTMDPGVAVRILKTGEPEKLSPCLEEGIPVILVSELQSAPNSTRWSEWPDQVRQARDRRDNPDTATFLIYDVPEFTPWHLANQLLD